MMKVGNGDINPRFYVLRIRSKDSGEAQIYFENELVFNMAFTESDCGGIERDRHAVRVSGAYVGAKMYIAYHDHSGNTGKRKTKVLVASV